MALDADLQALRVGGYRAHPVCIQALFSADPGVAFSLAWGEGWPPTTRLLGLHRACVEPALASIGAGVT